MPRLLKIDNRCKTNLLQNGLMLLMNNTVNTFKLCKTKSVLISNTSWAKFTKINYKWMKITTLGCCITKYPLVCKWDGNLRVIWCDAVVSFLWLDRDWRAPLGFPWGGFYPVGHVMDFLLQWKTSDPYVCFALHMHIWLNCYCWGNSSILKGRFSKWF